MRYPGRLLTDEIPTRVPSKRVRARGSRGHRSIGLDGYPRRRTSRVLLVRLPMRWWSATAIAPATTARRRTPGSSPSAGWSRRGSSGKRRQWCRRADSALGGRTGRGAGPIVWVTDGQVTDSNDHPSDELTEECALLVKKHRISHGSRHRRRRARPGVLQALRTI